MNNRLSLVEIRNQIALTTSLPGARFGTSMDSDYVTTVQALTPLPQVWVVGQRIKATDDGSRFSEGLLRQSSRVEVVVRAIFQRYAEGQLSGETAANTIHDAIRTQLHGWMPTGAERPFYFVEEKDGQATDSVALIDFTFATEIILQKGN